MNDELINAAIAAVFRRAAELVNTSSISIQREVAQKTMDLVTELLEKKAELHALSDAKSTS